MPAKFLPKITGLLVFENPAVWYLAREAAKSFCSQVYPNKQLIVVNTVGSLSIPSRKLSAAELREVRVGTDPRHIVPVQEIQPTILASPSAAAIEMRMSKLNAENWPTVFRAIDSNYVAFVGYDSIWHPLRLSYLSTFLADDPVQLSTELRYSRRSRKLCLVHRPDGLPGTTILRKAESGPAFATGPRKLVIPAVPHLNSMSLTVLLAGTKADEATFLHYKSDEPSAEDEAYAATVLASLFGPTQ